MKHQTQRLPTYLGFFFKYPEHYLNSMTRKHYRRTALCFDLENILHACIFNNNTSAIYPSVYTACYRPVRLKFIRGIRHHPRSAGGPIIGSSFLFPRGHSPYGLWGSRSWWTSYGTADTLPLAGWGCVWVCACWASSSGWMTGHTPRNRIFIVLLKQANTLYGFFLVANFSAHFTFFVFTHRNV